MIFYVRLPLHQTLKQKGGRMIAAVFIVQCNALRCPELAGHPKQDNNGNIPAGYAKKINPIRSLPTSERPSPYKTHSCTDSPDAMRKPYYYKNMTIRRRRPPEPAASATDSHRTTHDCSMSAQLMPIQSCRIILYAKIMPIADCFSSNRNQLFYIIRSKIESKKRHTEKMPLKKKQPGGGIMYTFISNCTAVMYIF